MKPFLLGLLVLVSCAPSQQLEQSGVLPPEQTRALIQRFSNEFQLRGIVLTAASGQTVSPPSENALLGVVKKFNLANPGFCALLDSPFVADQEQLRFMTITSRGTDIRVLIYDRSDASRLIAVTAIGTVARPLAARACQLAWKKAL